MINRHAGAMPTTSGRRASLRAACGASALMVGVLANGGAVAGAPIVDKLVVVSSGSIFGTCKADHVGSQPGTNYPYTSIEPNFAINPRDPHNFLVGIQQDRWSNGGCRGLRGSYSLDNGATFHATSTPYVTQCQNGPWPRASDPWVSFSPDGTAYFSELVTEELVDPNNFGHNGQTVSKSTDGGINWSRPITLIDTPREPDVKKPQALNDKNAVTADPTDSRYVYVVWDKLTSFTPGYGVNDESGGSDGGHPPGSIGPAAAAAPAAGHDVMSIARRLRDLARKGTPFGHAAPLARAPSANAATPAFPTYVTGPTYFSRTTDRGNTWEKARIIYDPGSNVQTIGNQIVTLPNGDLLDFFTQQNDLSGADSIGWVRSSDHGATWSPAYQALDLVNSGGVVTPNKQEAIRSADILFAAAVDQANNIIYVTWQDSRFTGQSEATVAFSIDGGYSWFGPVRVGQTPRNPLNPVFQQSIIPSVVPLSDGRVVVTYYDFRNDVQGAAADLADVWAVSCNPLTSADACQSNADWTSEIRVTDESFDFDNAPVANGHFVGDYQGLRAKGTAFWPVFGVATDKNVTKILTRKIVIPTPAPAAVAAR